MVITIRKFFLQAEDNHKVITFGINLRFRDYFIFGTIATKNPISKYHWHEQYHITYFCFPRGYITLRILKRSRSVREPRKQERTKQSYPWPPPLWVINPLRLRSGWFHPRVSDLPGQWKRGHVFNKPTAKGKDLFWVCGVLFSILINCRAMKRWRRTHAFYYPNWGWGTDLNQFAT